MTKEVEKKATKTTKKKVVDVKKKIAVKKEDNDKSVSKLDVDKTVKNTSKTKDEMVGEVDTKKEEKNLEDYLPERFYPRYSKHGMIGTGGCVIVPNRIFYFIESNVTDWYMKMDELPFKTEIGFLHALLYYIIEDGYVNIHEIGSNSYYKLTISDKGNSEENSRV